MNTTPAFPFHFSSHADLKAPPEKVFALLDDPKILSSHMEESSWMMAGSKMHMELDEKNGRALGAKIVLHGSMIGIPLFVQEFVTQREPDRLKTWQTSGEQKMLVIDQYEMGFKINPTPQGSHLEVFIKYSLPSSGFPSVLGRLFGGFYAKWCTDHMAKDASKHFRS